MIDWESVSLTSMLISSAKVGMTILLGLPPSPFKIAEIQKTKPGKHGSSKYRVKAFSLWDGQAHQQIFVQSHSITFCPLVRTQAVVRHFSSTSGLCSVIDQEGVTIENLVVRDSDIPQLKALLLTSTTQDISVQIIKAMGVTKVINPVLVPSKNENPQIVKVEI